MHPGLLLSLLALACLTACTHTAPTPTPNTTTVPQDPNAQAITASIDRTLAFWHETIDHHQGGYNTTAPNLPETKRLTLSQARLVWTFATAHLEGHSTPDRDYLAAARHGYRYLNQNLRDPTTHTHPWSVTPAGETIESGRDLYSLAFTIYAYSAYARAANDPEPLNQARHLLHWIEEHLHDPTAISWHELAEPDGTPILTQEDAEGLGGIARPPYRSANAILHLLEALNEYLLARPNDPLARDMVARAHDILTTYIYPLNPEDAAEWTLPDGQHVPDEPRILSLGHNVEAAWLLAETDERLGRTPNLAIIDTYLRHADRFATTFIPTAVHAQSQETPKSPAERIVQPSRAVWWVQAEYLAAVAFGAERQAWPIDRAVPILDWYQNHQIDLETAVPYTLVNTDGEPAEGVGPSIWKAAYHDLRMRWMLRRALNQQPQP
ncbi:AGE family epimerase/isomerase [Mucisphaera sp.]|uniref:AGE family epimerase/isomerase n=1 Tax=Mucisphaera sp. TaxID=2913024 RepID=UPI003D0E24B9